MPRAALRDLVPPDFAGCLIRRHVRSRRVPHHLELALGGRVRGGLQAPAREGGRVGLETHAQEDGREDGRDAQEGGGRDQPCNTLLPPWIVSILP